jgi:crotonobetainyl-CoA:carnitine CoA-transferase CaiB-like acyl-CoA transferase
MMTTDTHALPTADRRPRPRKGPLAGIRVADFCWMGVGALATRLLADLGAEVIKIEDRTRLDLTRRVPVYKGEPARPISNEDSNPDPNRSGLFNNYNRNKLGVTINMRTARGRALADQLIGASSIVSENFAPGVMEAWGLTYERLRQIRPDIIYARMSGFGHDGPNAAYRSYGPVVQAVSGLSYISGIPDSEPSGWGFSYMDNMAAYYNASALLMAIFHRGNTGEGTEIDVSAVEVGIGLIGPLLLDVTVNGRPTRRPDFPPGNRLEHPPAAPHGVYRCAGDEPLMPGAGRWCAIAVFDDDEWARLCAALDHPAWTRDPRFATQADRCQNQDALNRFIEEWTSRRAPHEVMTRLQAHGVCAAAVQTAQDLNERDPQLANRGLFFDLGHPVIGEARFEGVPLHFAGFAPDHWRSAPLQGEDNDYVFGELLGISRQECEALTAEGVI